ncbi:MAG: hypothetical protein LC793_15840 [Thermomicrobia bacterium]|nr:hypothetical protein [Thermomicrobia bacterium]MCA1724529.1 hypothetical protein [Thermomicrobia bacterium]
MGDREEAHRLVNALLEEKLIIARRFLDALLADTSDPLLQALWFAPIDDEPDMGQSTTKRSRASSK